MIDYLFHLLPLLQYIDKFRRAVDEHKKDIVEKSLISEDHPAEAILPEIKDLEKTNDINSITNEITEIKLDNNGDSEIRNTTEPNSKENDIYNTLEFKSNTKEPIDNALDAVTNKENFITNTDRSYLENNKETNNKTMHKSINKSKLLEEIFPFGHEKIKIKNGQICLDSIERNKRILLRDLRKNLTDEEIGKLNCFAMKDVDIDSPDYVNEKVMNVGFDKKENYMERINNWTNSEESKPYYLDGKGQGKEFDFDYQPDLEGHPGPSPSVILQVCIGYISFKYRTKLK